MKFIVPTFDERFELIIDREDVLIFIGANGTGKTRLGYFLEEDFFRQKSDYLKSKRYKLRANKRELQYLAELISQETDRLSELLNSKKEDILDIATKYQDEKIARISSKNISRIELAKISIEERIGLEASFIDAELKECEAPKSLKKFTGKIIIGRISLATVLLNVAESDFLSIEAAKNYLISEQEALLQENQRKYDEVEKEIKKMESSEEFSYCERISAHRSLVIQEKYAPKDVLEAENELLFGDPNKIQDTKLKWGKQPLGGLQTDFDKLMTAFFSEEAESGAKFRQNPEIQKPITNFDKALSIWNKIFPHRRIELKGLKICVTTFTNSDYSITELSEGERTLLYVLGKCLFVKKNSLIIIDEPDIHIHKAILSSFFDEIEKERDDCAFIYITHDLNFAESRANAKKYVLQEYSHPNKWKLHKLTSIDIPEQIYGLVYGSRKNVLFVEGKESNSSKGSNHSLDVIYKYVYEDFHVIPVGSCGNVKSYTKSLNKNMRFHRIQCLGLIDRDDLPNERIESNRQDGVYVSPVADIENLFLIPSVAQHIYRIVGIEEFDEIKYFEEIIREIQKYKEDWQVESIKQRIASAYKRKIESMPSHMLGFVDKINDLNMHFSPQLIVDSFREDYEKRLLRAKTERNLIYILEIFRVKSSLHFLSQLIGLKGKTVLESRILGNISKDEGLKNALKECLPEIKPRQIE